MSDMGSLGILLDVQTPPEIQNNKMSSITMNFDNMKLPKSKSTLDYHKKVINKAQ